MMAVVSQSGTYTYDPAASDLVLEAYSRCGIRGGALNGQHMWDARMSCQLELAQWSVRVPNLWLVTLVSIPLYQGVSTYSVPSNTVTVLDAYMRIYQVGNPVNVAVNMSTTAGSTSVTIYWPANNLYATQWIEVTIPVSIGGVIIQGFYQVTSVIDANDFTITLPSAALTTATNTGTLPSFTSSIGSATVTVVLANHGYSVGQYFTVQLATTVGGLALSGSYQIQSVTSSSVFTILAVGLASTVATVYENSGLQSYASQEANVDPIDRILNPMSRSDYAAQPDKYTQAPPTTYWYNRQINPLITMWPAPDGNGPYVLNIYVVTQPQDVTLQGGVGLNIPFRFYEAFAAGLAKRLARKYAPALVAELTAEYTVAWNEAAQEDIEEVPWFITPILSGAFK